MGYDQNASAPRPVQTAAGLKFPPALKSAVFTHNMWALMATAPKDGTRVIGWIPETEVHYATTEIVFWGKHNHMPIYGWIYRSGRLGDEEVEGCEPTHWAPLPMLSPT